ncbi:non-ribosomal peptide synthetase [Cylindrospermum sp. FACHB-282]|uniref:non-ribosomal peptide synthetase n=1 Tax=Cylindrospermum sp. FACHB-282 TaxID=2692794 RepID=UPI001684EE35|nr:non-ribosomal peptide synthetase [Cylindrospermum sp. FACHB-282]MBD2385063.1 amino acid adenylation domain-containing protein [Cylindrospermum sp. FACHB-282]
MANDTFLSTSEETFVFPLSFAQERLWFLNQLEGANATYNMPAAIRLSGQLDVKVLEQALGEIVQRHEVLRTSFQTLDGKAVQIIATEVIFNLCCVNLQHLPEVEREITVQQWVTQEATKPFTLSQAPLMRATLLQTDIQEYVLLVTMHHIISDAWSVGIVIRELSVLYQAFIQNQPHTLPELDIQYADFVQWQREWLQGDRLDKQLAYWKHYLAGVPPVLKLPTDRPRPPVQTFQGQYQRFELGSDLSIALKQLAQENSSTLFMVLFAAFATLLHRYSSQQDIVVGTPIANRNQLELEPLIGFFVNTLVLRAQFDETLTLRELLKQVRQGAMESYAHQDVPFEKIVEALQPERNLSHSPIFQVWFVLQNTPSETLQLPDVTLTPLLSETKIAKFDLTLSMSETKSGLVGVWQYNTDLFDAGTIARMVEHFQVLLTAIATNPQQQINLLPLLKEQERQQLLNDWNDTDAPYPKDHCIHQIFEQQVMLTPDAVALVFGEDQLTYQQLNHRANQLAHHLQTIGVGPEVLVGLCVNRSLDMVVGLLGILKAGGAYVPLDPNYPEERLAYILEDSAVSVLLIQESLEENLPPSYALVVYLDADWDEIATQSCENPVSQVQPHNLAYVIYTSGSTGQPKGVLVSHHGIGNLALAQQTLFKIEANSRVLQFASFGFDASVSEIFMALGSGAQLVLASAQQLMPGFDLQRTIAHHEITHITLPPSALAILPVDDMPTLKQVIVAGEACPEPLARIWSQGRHFFNAYGPSEATVCATVAEVCLNPEIETNSVIPIGRPIANTQIYILDNALQPVPTGVPGELYISGVGLARGYLNQPQLTAARFIENPFREGRLYKTGDLARYLPDGNIEFLGRLDRQVKIRGFRIELGEVEAKLGQHPQIQETTVVTCEDSSGNQRLVAYVVSREQTLVSSELRQFLKDKLPEYMVPSIFVMLDLMPLTPNGKIDHRSLPSPDQDLIQQNNFVEPRTPTEQTIADIFAAVLKIEQVGVYNNFFDLGGHSLLATQVISRLRESFSIELPLGTLFESPTVAELDSIIQQWLQNNPQQDTGVTQPLPAVVAVPREEMAALPLSWAQERLWFLDQLEGNSATYNIPMAVHLRGNLNIDALEQALQEIVQRHEVLRTHFATVDGNPVQVISTASKFCLFRDNLQLSSTDKLAVEVKERLTQEAQRPFDLTQSPLIRGTLLQTADNEYILLVTMHHIVADGWSVRVMVKELSIIYDAFVHGLPSPLPPLAIQYADFVHWQRQWLQGDILERQLTYWKTYLLGAPPLLELPTDYPRAGVQTFRGAQQPFELSAKLIHQLKQVTQATDTTLFMVLCATFLILLHRYSGQDDMVVGTVMANRNRTEIEPLIGFFVNTLVLRTQFEEDSKFIDILKQVQQGTLEGYANQDVPFEKIVEALQPERNLSHSPLFQVMFSLQNAANSLLQLPDVSLTPLKSEIVTAKFDLTLSMVATENSLSGVWEYNTDLFKAETIARMIGHFQVVLEGIVANAQETVGCLPLLTQQEEHQLLVTWNNTVVAYSQDCCLHQQFEEQVERTPEAIALIFRDQQLTYRQLNQQANQLAHYLQRQGIGPETLVGICVERSLSMMVGLLGILKAGAAYVPLDPHHPQERLAFILSDTQMPVLLTQEKLQATLPDHAARVICLDTDWVEIAQEDQTNPDTLVSGEHLAYLIYTSGSTGQPKGVMIEHSQVANFCVAMDQRLGLDSSSDLVKTWLAVTTISFDISILELFWTLARGFKVVIQQEQEKTIASTSVVSRLPETPMEFSLFYFANDSDTGNQNLAQNRYKLLIEGAKFADQHGFSAVWTPERHFHEFGGIYPNPSVAGAAIAAVTKQIKIRAGSVVLPLHHEIRVAEEWAFVDNLSNGRVGISFASGWQPNDFVLSPENYQHRKSLLVEQIETVRKLWRGEPITLKNGHGIPTEVRTFPKPIQSELPAWLTAAGNPETFRLAGELGLNVLTHLLGQGIEELAEKIKIYRQAWQQKGHPGNGHITLMLHTFIGDDEDAVREQVRVPLSDYLEQSMGLIQKMLKGTKFETHLDNFAQEDQNTLLSHAFDRYFATSGLLGTPEKCLTMIDNLKAIGVDEVGCLIDFGVNVDSVLSSLDKLNQVRKLSNSTAHTEAEDYSILNQIQQHQVSHLQCTPSLARMLTLMPNGLESLRSLRHLMLGGEALPPALVKQLGTSINADIYNMYGPTEATIWASTAIVHKNDVETKSETTITIGKPIANTQIYILDQWLNPVPIGVPGELHIGGMGLARGYLNRPQLTADRFIEKPFGSSKSHLRNCDACGEQSYRLYKTGDLARYLSDGNIEFLGRIDYQVKLRGFRIELGEIEAALNQHPQIQQAVVILDGTQENQRLVGYIVPHSTSLLPTDTELHQFLLKKLPDYMVPNIFVQLDQLPLTPNGKINRRALPAPSHQSPSPKYLPPRTPVERQLSQIWAEVLNLDWIGIRDNFFELGGRSLLAVQLMSRIQEVFGQQLPLAILFQAPTIENLARQLVHSNSTKHSSCLVPIQPQGSKLPLFFIPGSGGSVVQFYELSRCLGLDQPLYGLQAQGLDEQSNPLNRVEDMATQYLEAIQTLQPQGPYILGGHSLGGKVAFEIARQLLQQGQEIRLLAIVDATAPLPDQPVFTPSDWNSAQWLSAIAAGAADALGITLDISYEMLNSLSPEAQFSHLQNQFVQNGILAPQDSETQLKNLIQLTKLQHTSAVNYQCLEQLPLPITLFRAEQANTIMFESNSLLNEPKLGWDRVSTQPVTCHLIPGSHYSIMANPYVEELAKHLQGYLN